MKKLTRQWGIGVDALSWRVSGSIIVLNSYPTEYLHSAFVPHVVGCIGHGHSREQYEAHPHRLRRSASDVWYRLWEGGSFGAQRIARSPVREDTAATACLGRSLPSG